MRTACVSWALPQKCIEMACINVPFRLVTLENAANVMPVVEGSLNGHPIRLVVDTGASHTCMDKTTLKQLAPSSLSLRKKQASETESITDTVMGIGGRRLSHALCTLPSLFVGDLELRDYMVVTVRMNNVNKMLHWIGQPPINGLLGCDVLRAYRASLDFSSACICFPDTSSDEEVPDPEG